MSDFHNSYNEALWGHVPIGLKPYISTRNTHAFNQLNLNNISPVIKYIKNNHIGVGDDFWVRSFIEDDDENPVVNMIYKINNGSTLSELMYDDGAHNDGEANDGFFACMIIDIPVNTIISYQIKAEDIQGNNSIMPFEPIIVQVLQSTENKLFINEFLASNTNVIADEFGEYEDWIEIYNNGNPAVNIGDLYFTDDLNDPTKWAFPETNLAANAFLLLWADNETNQGALHLPFKLSSDGEEIGLYNRASSGTALIHSVVFGAQAADISYGIFPDAIGYWTSFSIPTPGTNNVLPEPGIMMIMSVIGRTEQCKILSLICSSMG